MRGQQEVRLQQFTVEFAISVVYSLIGKIEDTFRCSGILQSLAVFSLSKIPDSLMEVVASFGKNEMRLLAHRYDTMKESKNFHF